MCATSEQNTLQTEQMDAYKQAQDLVQQQYGNQQGILAKMSAVLDPILKAGPSQRGFSDAERNDLNSQAIQGTAQNYKSASQAIGENLAVNGGGSLPMSGGPEAQIKAETATSAAGTLSSEQNEIQQQDYETGRQNFDTALSGEGNIASLENPTAYQSNATASGNSADAEANAIASENNSWINAALGAAGAVGEGWATGGFKH